MKRIFAIMAVTAAVLSMLVAGPAGLTDPSPTSAHERYARIRQNKATISENHKVLTVCDNHKGNRVEAWVWDPSGVKGPYRDRDGYKPGCTDYELRRGAYKIAICENRVGCSGYKKA